MFKVWFVCKLYLCGCLFTAMAMAQVTSGTISGTVADSTGAVIPGATVRLKNVETGIERTATTDSGGRYRVAELHLGNYEITAEQSGFQTVARSGVTLTVAREAVVDFVLQVGAVTEQVTVTGEAPLVNTANSTVATLVDQGEMRDMPLNGRSFDNLTAIQPGVVSSLPLLSGITQAVYIGGGTGARHSIGGTKPQQSTYLLDGMEITTPSEGMPVNSVLGQQLGVDGIREFSVLESNFGAQFGRAAGGVVNAVTQSGTNSFHGTLFEFLRNQVLDAREYFNALPEPHTPLKRNQFGASLGGPIQKDRTFFFLNYEGVRQAAGDAFLGSSYTPQTRTGNVTNAQGQVAEVLPVDPNIVPLMNLLPVPNGRFLNNGVAQFFSVFPWNAHEHYGIARVDRQLSGRDSLFGRVTLDRSDFTDNLDPLFPKGFYDFQVGGYIVAAISETRAITPSVLNAARIGYTRRNDHLFYNYTQGGDQFPNAPGLDPRLSPVRGVPMGLYNLPGVIMYGNNFSVGPSLSGPAVFVDNTFNYSDSIIISRGRHSINVGADIKRYQEDEKNEPWVYGQFTWQTIETFLANQPFSDTQFIGSTIGNTQMADVYRGWRQTYSSLYVNDDVRVWPSLTLNLGVRWERLTSPKEVNGKLAVLKNIFTDSQFTSLHAGDPLFTQTDGLKGFQPRAGFAWSPFQNQKTVLRGGFGAFEEPLLEYIYQLAINAPPYATRYTVNAPNLKFPFPFANPSLVATAGEPLMLPLQAKVPYTLQWTFSIERQLGQTAVAKINYMGMRGLNQYTIYNPNQPQTQVVNGRQFTPATARAPNPNFTSYRYVAPISDQFYHALQVVMEKRLSRGLRFESSFTFSRNIDDGGSTGIKGAESVSSGAFAISNGFDHKADRGLSILNVQRNFITSGTYDFPWGSGRHWGSQWNGWTDRLLGGWSLNSVMTLRSGLPVPIAMTPKQDRCSAQTCVERPDLIPGGNNNPVLPHWTPNQYYDPSQFAVPALGFFGNLGRNTVIGPGLFDLDLSFLKEIRITEGKTLQFRAEFFNILNHPNFGMPSVNVFVNAAGALDPNAGRITSTSTTMRQIQFGLKFKF